MRNNPARAALTCLLISGLAALAVVGYLLSSPSDQHRQFLLGYSLIRLALAFVLVLAAAACLGLAGYAWRRPASAESWIRLHLSSEGWLRVFAFFTSASLFMVALAIVCYVTWTPVPSMLLLRFEPAALWLMIFTVLTMLFLGLLKDPVEAVLAHGEAGRNPPATQTGPGPSASSFQREFIVGCLVILLCTSTLLVVNVLIGLAVNDHLSADLVALIRPALRSEFRPEQVERTRYVASALLFPILAIVSWALAGKLQRGVPRSTPSVGAAAFLGVTAGLACWLYFSLRAVDFRYIQYLYSDLRLGGLIPLYGAFVLLIVLERSYSTRVWMRWVLGVGASSITIMTALAVASGSILTSADDYVYSVNFNAYFYSIVQVLLGKTLLVDLSNQYGFYPYFLQPVFRLIGFDVPQLTLAMGGLTFGFFVVVFFLLVRLAKSRVLAACGFLSIVWVWLGARFRFSEPYFAYFPHRVLFPGTLLLLVFLYQKSRGRRKSVISSLAFLVCGVGLLWNMDTGVITFAAWLLYLYWEALSDWRAVGTRRTAIVIGLQTIKAFGTLGAALLSLLVYTYARSGSMPNLSELGFYQSLFYQTGFNMLPMPLLHPWNLVALIYMVALSISACSLLKRLRGEDLSADAGKRSWVNMVYFVTVLGAGLFTVYQGRSHNHNLMATFWSAFFLMTLFVDALLDRVIGDAKAARSLRPGLNDYWLLPLPLLILFTLFAGVPAFFGKLPDTLRGLQAQVAVMQEMARGRPSPNAERLEFMRRYFWQGEGVPIFSSRYDTIFYVETRTTNPVRVPGWNELFLLADVIQYERYLENSQPRTFLVSDEFASACACPDLYSLIQDGYVEVDRVEDLALFLRRDPDG